MTSPNLDDISSALLTGLRAAESLMTHLRPNSDAYELAEHYRNTCEQGVKAFDQLRAQLRDGKRQVEAVDPEPPTSCYCAATPHPPCSFCTPNLFPCPPLTGMDRAPIDPRVIRRQIGDPTL